LTELRLTLRHVFAYAFAVPDDRRTNTLLIAASLIAAVRTAKEDNIMPTSPRIIARVQDSIRLARMVRKFIEEDRENRGMNVSDVLLSDH